jgi:hypothetical protein
VAAKALVRQNRPHIAIVLHLLSGCFGDDRTQQNVRKKQTQVPAGTAGFAI